MALFIRKRGGGRMYPYDKNTNLGHLWEIYDDDTKKSYLSHDDVPKKEEKKTTTPKKKSATKK